MKRALRSSEAQKDIEEIVSYYSKRGLFLADRFIDEYEAIIREIEMMPGIGTLRFASELDVPNLHVYPLHDFPYLIFYFEREKYVDVVRVLHSHRDIPGLLWDIK